MATYTFTSTDVIAAGGSTNGAVAGEALAAGEFIYLDAGDGNKAKKAECDNVSARAKAVGICLNSAAVGQPISYTGTGEITVQTAAFLAVGAPLVLSGTAGKCMDAADLVNTQYVTFIGYSVAANKFKFDLNPTGVQKA